MSRSTGDMLFLAAGELLSDVCGKVARDLKTHNDVMQSGEGIMFGLRAACRGKSPNTDPVPVFAIMVVGEEAIERVHDALSRCIAQIGEDHADAVSEKPR